MDNLTSTAGKYIRDVLRNDSTLLSLLGITADKAMNYIFFGTPSNQISGFENPRITIISKPSNADSLAYTGIYQGIEEFQVNLWINDNPFSNAYDVLDRITTLFNKQSYSITNNVAEFKVANKFVIKDPDKQNTNKGELSLILNIGGIS